MLIRSVNALAFGPLKQSTIDLAPQMTVVYGPNESGKSSWHAAIYAAICGIRRGGGLKLHDRMFRIQHMPWDSEKWAVNARIELADGRLIELSHDLAGKVASGATDATLGRDVSAEIIFDGSVDASLWLGLNRQSFLATAGVRQTEILQLLEDPGQLQEHLQRAAATAGVDETAARAIATIEQFRKDNVGMDRRNSTKPLRAAVDGSEQCRSRLVLAQEAHREYLQLEVHAETQRDLAEKAERRLRTAETVQRRRKREQLEDRVRTIQELTDLFPNGAPSSRSIEDDLATEVAAALAELASRPPTPPLTGTPADELRQELSRLPEVPAGDVTVDPILFERKNELSVIRATLSAHSRRQPSLPSSEWEGVVSESEVRELARELDLPMTTFDSDQSSEDPDRATRALKTSPAVLTGFAVSLVLFLSGVVFTIFRSDGPGVWIAAIGALLTVGFGGAMLLKRADRRKANRDQLDLAARLAPQRMQQEQAIARRQSTMRRIAELGLPQTSMDLRQVADAIDDHTHRVRECERWDLEYRNLTQEVERADERLGESLVDKGLPVGPDPIQTYEQYERECSERSQLANQASRREDLIERLDERTRAEKQAETYLQARNEAIERVRTVALRCGIETTELDGQTGDLGRWQLEHRAALEESENQQGQWAKLEALLDGSNLATLEEDLARLSDSEEDSDETPLDIEFQDDPTLETTIAQLRSMKDDAAKTANQAQGKAAERAGQILSVAEAEEALNAAEIELERIRSLDATLGMTLDYLTKAQEGVHRTIAPFLNEAVGPWLGQVTDGRYTEVRVDPVTLGVKVKTSEGTWREAAGLSHGTMEQIYLLLRVAIARLLTKPGESCPLILDDVAVHSDAHRTTRILETLQMISSEHQIIFFSQEREVLEWAEDNLQGENNSLIRLDPQLINP